MFDRSIKLHHMGLFASTGLTRFFRLAHFKMAILLAENAIENIKMNYDLKSEEKR